MDYYLVSRDLIPVARIINPFSRDLNPFAWIIISFSRDIIPFARIIIFSRSYSVSTVYFSVYTDYDFVFSRFYTVCSDY